MVAVGLTAYIAYRHGQDALNDLANQLMVEVSDRVGDHLESYLEIPVQVTNDNVNAIELGLLDWRNLPKLERYYGQRLENFSESKHELRSLLLISENQNVIVENQPHKEWSVNQPSFATNQPLQHYISFDEQNSHRSAEFGAEQQAFQPEAWYQAAKNASLGIWQLVAVQQDMNRSSLAAVYLKQFYDANHVSQGVVGASIDLANVSQYLSNLNISPRGQAFIVDSSGTFIATSTKEPLTAQFKDDLANPSFSTDPTQQPKLQSRVEAIHSLNSVTRDAAYYLKQTFGDFGSIPNQQPLNFKLNGKSYFLRVTPLQNPKNLNWFLVVAIPEVDFVAQLDHHYHTVLGLSGLAMLGAIALGLATAQGIARPILRLSRASRDLMLGKLDAPVNEQTRITELAVMAHSFNEMTEQLMQSFDQVKLALQESEEKYTTVFRTSPDPIMVTTLPEGTILEVNESFLRLMGISREEVIGNTAVELGLWTNLEDRKKLMQIIHETGRVYGQEVTTITRYGTHVTVLLSSEQIELEGRPCLLTVAKDITERKRTEEALRISEARFRMAFDTAAIGMNIASLSGHFLQVNPTLCQMLGYAEADLLQLTYLDITHPDDLELDHDANSKIMTGEVSSLSYEKRFIHRDGQLVWVLLSLALIRDLQQQPLYWVAQVQNITARKQIQSALQQSEARFRAVFETASLGIAIADLEGNIVEANNALCQLCGLSQDQLQNMKLHQIIHPEDLPQWSRLMQELTSQWLDNYQLKTRCIHKDGAFIWTQLTTLLIRDSNSQPLYLVTRVESLAIVNELESQSLPTFYHKHPNSN